MSEQNMIECHDCGTEHLATQECWICGPLLRAKIKAREGRRQWAVEKQQHKQQREARTPHNND